MNHPGANHLYIPAIEPSPNPERAEAAADRLAGLVPGIGATLEGTATITQGVLLVVTVTLLSTVSAAGSLIVARSAEDRALLEAGDDVAGIGLSADEARELLGGSG